MIAESPTETGRIAQTDGFSDSLCCGRLRRDTQTNQDDDDDDNGGRVFLAGVAWSIEGDMTAGQACALMPRGRDRRLNLR